MAIAASMPEIRSAAGRADFLRRAVCFTGQVHDPAVTFGDQVVAREILARAGEPETGQRHEHEIGLDRLQRGIVDAELFLHAPDQVDDNYVRLLHQVVQDFASRFPAVIERNAFLVAVDGEKPQRFALVPRRTPRAAVVTAARPLDLDHARAHVAEQHRRIRARD